MKIQNRIARRRFFGIAIGIGLIRSAQAPADAKSPPPPRQQESKNMSHELQLKVRESITLPDGLRVTFDSYSIEQIAAAPGNSGAYPAGSGINLEFKLEKAGAQTGITFSELSAGYTSKTSERWQNYEISLGKIDGAGTRQMSVALHVVVVTDRDERRR